MHLNTADTVFVIFSTTLVMLMTPGLALFYAGMVKKKNAVNTTMNSYIAIALVSLQWILIGYTLSFGGDVGGFIGNFKYFLGHGVGNNPNADYAATIPQQLFLLFQMMFAIITPALISGAFAERMKFKAVIIFILAWTTLVYDPVAHWVWGTGGWLKKLGALDFAGGNVVHITSGVSALVVAIVLGERKKKAAEPHHVPMTLLGAGLLWFGWFGFNAGSALAVNSVAVNAFLTTNTSAAAAALAWMLVEYIHTKKASPIGFASGAVAGLVAITPAAGYVSMESSIIIGLVGGVICFCAVTFMKEKFGYDDALDAFGCHGIGGTWGGLATGLFASKSINSAGANGLFYGNPKLLGIQAISILAVYAFAGVTTFIILKVIDKFVTLRASETDEEMGLDLAIHGAEAYEGFMQERKGNKSKQISA